MTSHFIARPISRKGRHETYLNCCIVTRDRKNSFRFFDSESAPDTCSCDDNKLLTQTPRVFAKERAEIVLILGIGD